MNLYVESLGCARNLVDSELIIGQLKNNGFTILDEPHNAEIIIINTCSFIENAINESIDTILHLAKYKQTGSCRYMIVAGCLPERFREKIVSALPEVDLFLGTGALDQVTRIVDNGFDIKGCMLPDPDRMSFMGYTTGRALSGSPMAYLKIAEGCDKHCTYCIIPKLRGKHKSRPIINIVDEARMLISNGIKEIVLVAQETTFYGKDLTPPADISGLLERISGLSDNIWIRVLYGHPESLNNKLIKTIATHENICSYFDIPIQHASNSILKRMGRNYVSDDLYRCLDQIRSYIPHAALRTTVIIGFPGESDQDFETLLTFIQKVRFNHLGAFIYSDFEDLASHNLSDPVSATTAKYRYDEIMSCQQGISLEANRAYIGKELKVLVEDAPETGMLTGRTDFQAPEVDGMTYIQSDELSPGSFVNVNIIDALEYDLIGKPV
ncbi:MAG: 30S ribosomal protein S12 methylthiotransferase RimO [Deltaproteobacteria bacterium]|nr:30S ribosomal protein S12 methylthiotransferase RimO [Deltaproteobacteria bacterium]